MALPVRRDGLRETCYFCGYPLPNRCYAVEVRGDLRLVCHHCFGLYHDGAYRLLRVRNANTFVCDGCGRTMLDSAYSPTTSGSYCVDCVSRTLESLRQLRMASEYANGGE